MKCEDCKYYEPTNYCDESNGNCKRHAPIQQTYRELRENGVFEKMESSGFPFVKGNDWCGDFEQKKPKD